MTERTVNTVRRTSRKYADKPIKFGTDGWRGIISYDLTADNLIRVAKAITAYLLSEERRGLEPYSWHNANSSYKLEYRPASNGIVIGYDTRFMSSKYALEVARVLTEYGINVILSSSFTTTPATSLAVVKNGTAGGIMITASHNPPEYNGVKFKAEHGGSALPEMTKLMEKLLDVELKPAERQGELKVMDFNETYLETISKMVDLDAIAFFMRSKGIYVIIDYMFGAAQGQFSKLMSKNKSAMEYIIELHSEENPGFMGLHPEPLPKYLTELEREVRLSKGIGFAFDGDGDRIGAFVPQGFVSPHEILALLTWYLVEYKGWSGKVVRTISTSTKAARVAKLFGLESTETPVGFKHIGKLFLTDDVLIGGEESGGIGIKNHIPERDSLLNALLLLEFMAKTGKHLSELLDELHDRIGYTYCTRRDMSFESDEERDTAFEYITTKIPERISELKVLEVDRKDGIKLFLENGCWVLARKSGTEPLIRVYAEATSKEMTEKILGWTYNYLGEKVKKR